MNAGYDQAHRLAVIEAARALIRDAMSEARACDPKSADWQYYNGIQTAGLHVLYPEMANVHEGTPWLDNVEPAFRDGFLAGSAALAAATTSHEPPLRLPLPQRR